MKKPKYIEPINPYTGKVSAVAIMENIENGYRTFPKNMGNVFRKAPPQQKLNTCKRPS